VYQIISDTYKVHSLVVDTVIPGTRRAKIIEFERPDISGSHIYANRLDRLRLRTGWLDEI